jgi:hypothetical protein
MAQIQWHRTPVQVKASLSERTLRPSALTGLDLVGAVIAASHQAADD